MSPRPLISLIHILDRTSQNLTTPSLLTLHSSASFTGLKATFSMGAECPFKSVENRTFGFSGFPAQAESQLRRFTHLNECINCYVQTRRVLSEDPVATRVPRGFQAIERMLYGWTVSILGLT